MLVLTVAKNEAVQSIASKLGARLITCPPEKGRADLFNLAMTKAQGTWILWLEPGETISDEDLRKLAEIAGADSASLPSIFAVEVRTPGIGPHREVDMRIRDAFRFHQASRATRYLGRLMPLPDFRSDRFGLEDPVWTDIVIVQAETFHATATPLDEMSLDDSNRRPCCDENQVFAYEDFCLGQRLGESGMHARAIDYLHRSITNDPSDRWHAHKAYSALIHALTQQGRYDAAEATWQAAKRRFPQDSETWFRGGTLHHIAGNFTRAVACYQVSFDQHHRYKGLAAYDSSIANYKAKHNMALACFQSGESEKAATLWQEVLLTAPGCRAALLGFGELLVASKKGPQALFLAREMQGKGLVGDAQVLKALAAQAAGKTFEARRHLEAGVRFAPGEILPLRKLCEHFFEHGPDDEIEPAFLELANRSPREATTWLNLGNFYLRSSRLAEAVASFRKALDLRPTFVEAATNLRHAVKAYGKENEAKEIWARSQNLSTHAFQRRSVPWLLVHG
jgi:pentatricopeptide repeat protein